MHQGWTARFQSFGWFFGIKIIKQNIVHVKHKYALSCFTQRSPVSKIWSSLVNITVWLGLARLNTIYSWASHIYFSCHSDLAWTGTPGSVVRSCKYPSSKTSGDFFCFNWVVFQSLFSKTYSIDICGIYAATSEQRAVCHQSWWPSVHFMAWSQGYQDFLRSPHFEHMFRADLCGTMQCVTGIHQTDPWECSLSWLGALPLQGTAFWSVYVHQIFESFVEAPNSKRKRLS